MVYRFVCEMRLTGLNGSVLLLDSITIASYGVCFAIVAVHLKYSRFHEAVLGLGLGWGYLLFSVRLSHSSRPFTLQGWAGATQCSLQWHSQAGAHAQATRGCVPPVQVCMRIIGTDSIIVDSKSGANWS